MTYEAAVELLIGHRWWLFRDDFLVYVEFCRGFHGESMAAIDWQAVAMSTQTGPAVSEVVGPT